jgi:hypothetical protein
MLMSTGSVAGRVCAVGDCVCGCKAGQIAAEDARATTAAASNNRAADLTLVILYPPESSVNRWARQGRFLWREAGLSCNN